LLKAAFGFGVRTTCRRFLSLPFFCVGGKTAEQAKEEKRKDERKR
jgi:hypothetical protein